MMHTGRKGWGVYLKIIGVWGREYDVLTLDIDLVVGPYRPEKNFMLIFEMKNAFFFLTFFKI